MADTATAPPLGDRLGAGGEAEVFEVATGGRDAYKRYRNPTTARSRKLAVMVANPPALAAEAGGHIAIAWPTALVRSPDGTVNGFLMPKVNVRRAVPVFQVYNPQSRRAVAPAFTWRYLLRTARNIASIVASLHDAGYVIGDLNESNFLVTDRALVVLVDCDSMQVRDPATGAVHRSSVGKPEFLAPELHRRDLSVTDRTNASDCFALAVLVFLLLMEGLHPFAGVWRGRGDPPDIAARVRHGWFPYRPWSRIRPPRTGLPMSVLPGGVRALMVRTFGTGLRHASRRPAARDWVVALERAERRLRTCRRSEHHVFASRLTRCPWCRRVRRGMPDPFPAPDGAGIAPRQPSPLERFVVRTTTRAWRGVARATRAAWHRSQAHLLVDVPTVSALAIAVWFLAALAPVIVLVVTPIVGLQGWRSLRRQFVDNAAAAAINAGTVAVASAGLAAVVGLEPFMLAKPAIAAWTVVHLGERCWRDEVLRTRVRALRQRVAR